MNDIDFNRLNGPQRRILRQTLMGVFSRKDLDVFLRDNSLGRLENLVEDGRFEHQVFELIEGLSRRGQLGDLMAAVFRDYPRAPALEQLRTHLGLTADQEKVSGDRLERIVRDAGFKDPFLWTHKLSAIGHQVCRISYPVSHGLVRGTGFLIDRDLVLTNYHVIESVLKGEAKAEDVRLSFGFAETADGPSPLDKYWLDQDWAVAYAPYGDADLQVNAGLPKATELDFAVLRLEKAAGEVEVSTGERGWVNLAEAVSPTRDDAVVFVLQHPDGKPLKQSIGLIQQSKTPLRLLYDADTDGGSSGGLVLNQSLKPMALHHAGDPTSREIKAEYNQGIPLPLIHGALRASGGPPKVMRSSSSPSSGNRQAPESVTLSLTGRGGTVRRPAGKTVLSGTPELDAAGRDRVEIVGPQIEPEASGLPSERVRLAGPPLLFFSYAREDKALREQLAKQLKILERQRIIQTWYDGNLDFGVDREPAIQQKLWQADIILLLASPDFLASDEIWERDLEIVKKRREDSQDNVRVIPIILRPIVWDETPFKKLRPLPFDRQAVSTRSGPNRDRAFAEIARAIRGIAVQISARR